MTRSSYCIRIGVTGSGHRGRRCPSGRSAASRRPNTQPAVGCHCNCPAAGHRRTCHQSEPRLEMVTTAVKRSPVLFSAGSHHSRPVALHTAKRTGARHCRSEIAGSPPVDGVRLVDEIDAKIASVPVAAVSTKLYVLSRQPDAAA